MIDRERWGNLLGRPTPRNRVIMLLWLLAAAVAAVRIGDMVAHPTLPGQPWQTATGEFIDFRDILWTPGRFVLNGGNPYDPVTYLAAHPWAQQFSPYPPVWLLLAVALAPLPFLVSGVVLQVLSLSAAVVLLHILCRWALPRWADLAVPAGLLWLNVWYPGRGTLSALSGVIATLGVVLVLRSVIRAQPPDGTRAGRGTIDVPCAVGVAFALLKPQFGIPVLIVALVAGRAREAWRGVVGIVLACVPMLVVVTVAAGGPIGFVQSLTRNLIHVTGPNSPGGASSPFQRRFDLYGVISARGLDDPPLWLGFALPLLALVIAVVVVRRTRDPFVVSMVVCAAILVGFFHPWYDVVLIIVPVALGVGAVLRGEFSGTLERLSLAATTLVVLHLHTVSTRLIPPLTVPVADLIDFLLVCAALVLAVSVALWSPRRHALAGSGPSRPAPA